MTPQDLDALYKRETGIYAPTQDQVEDDAVADYIEWLEEKIPKNFILDDKDQLINIQTKDGTGL